MGSQLGIESFQHHDFKWPKALFKQALRTPIILRFKASPVWSNSFMHLTPNHWLLNDSFHPGFNFRLLLKRRFTDRLRRRLSFWKRSNTDQLLSGEPRIATSWDDLTKVTSQQTRRTRRSWSLMHFLRKVTQNQLAQKETIKTPKSSIQTIKDLLKIRL